MKKTKKMIHKIMLALSCAGVALLIAAVCLFLSEGSFLNVPRADTAYIGFAAAGILYLIWASVLHLISQDKQALIEEHDERLKAIEAKSGIIAFTVQTLLLFTCMLLLIFTGYLKAVPVLCLIGVLAVSVGVFAAAQMYYKKIL